MSARAYHMGLLEGRAKRLSDLLEMAAPTDLICKEVRMLAEAALPLDPNGFKSWGVPSKIQSMKEHPSNESNGFQIQGLHQATG